MLSLLLSYYTMLLSTEGEELSETTLLRTSPFCVFFTLVLFCCYYWVFSFNIQTTICWGAFTVSAQVPPIIYEQPLSAPEVSEAVSHGFQRRTEVNFWLKQQGEISGWISNAGSVCLGARTHTRGETVGKPAGSLEMSCVRLQKLLILMSFIQITFTVIIDQTQFVS